MDCMDKLHKGSYCNMHQDPASNQICALQQSCGCTSTWHEQLQHAVSVRADMPVILGDNRPPLGGSPASMPDGPTVAGTQATSQSPESSSQMPSRILLPLAMQVLCLDAKAAGSSATPRNLLASGAKDSTVRVWDGTTGAALAVAEGHIAAVSVVAFSCR